MGTQIIDKPIFTNYKPIVVVLTVAVVALVVIKIYNKK
jgi:hypothetical protein